MESLNLSSSYLGCYYARLMLEEVARHEDFFHILLACIMATIYQSQLINHQNAMVQKILIHKIKAISFLRRRLLLPSAVTDDGVLLSIIELSHLEIMNGDRQAALLHRRHIERIVERRGGMSSLKMAVGVRALVEL